MISVRSAMALCMAAAFVAAAGWAPAIAQTGAGVQIQMEDGGSDLEPANRVDALIAKLEQSLGSGRGSPSRTIAVGGIQAALAGRNFPGDSTHVHSFLAAGSQGPVCHALLPKGTPEQLKPELSAAVGQCLQRLSAQAKAGGAGPAPAKASPAPAAIAAAPPRHADNWAKVEGVYLRTTTMIGAGGMPLPSYEPIVLLKDGSYFEVDEAAVEDMDLAAYRASKPNSWGKWSRSGTGFTFTDSRGRVDEAKVQNGTLFHTFPGEASGGKLAKKYTNISGGGTAALGGDVMVSAQKDWTFTADGRFQNAGTAGATNSGASTGVGSTVYSNRRMGGPGHYSIKRYTITLTYPDGHSERKFFAFGASKDPPKLDDDLIFLGSTWFVNMKD
jgi:hypothetical protein